MDSKGISGNRRSGTQFLIGCGVDKGKEVRMIQNYGLEQTIEEKVLREMWNVLKCLNMETIFKPKK